MPQIRPITDLRNTGEISELCNSTGEPVFITKNGYGDLVVMSNECYDRLIRRSNLYEEIDAAERQIAKGEGLDGNAVFENLKRRYGKV